MMVDADLESEDNDRGESSTSVIMSFWNNKRVLVTGGAGFLGSCVVQTARQPAAAEVFVPRRQGLRSSSTT